MNVRSIRLILMTTMATMVAVPGHLHGRAPQATQEDHAQHHPAVQEAPAMPTPMPEAPVPAASMAMNAMDQKLEELVKRMNAASGVAKVDAMAAVINAMVDQHKAMRNSMMPMMPAASMKMMGDGNAKQMNGASKK